jgi:hypothetical protein
MTKQEIIDWMNTSTFIDSNRDVDGCGNEWVEKIFERDGQLFLVNFCNGSPCHDVPFKIGESKHYNPIPVRRVVEMVEHVTYEPIK